MAQRDPGCAVAVEKEDGSGWAAAWPLVSGCAAPGDRAHAVPQQVVPMVEAATTGSGCGHDSGGKEGQWEPR